MRICLLSIIPLLMLNADESRPLIHLPKLSGLLVDGNSSEWQDQGLLITAFAEDAKTPTDPELFRTQARIAWTSEGLALLISVRSTAPWDEDSDLSRSFQKDSVEVFLRQGSEWKNLVQTVIRPGMDAAGKPGNFHWDYRGAHKSWSQAPDSSFARARVDGGYDLEVLMPWANLDLEAGPGLGCEMMLKINKVLPDFGRRQWLWRGAQNEEFHRIELDEQASASTHNRIAWVSLDDPDGVTIAAVAAANDVGAMVRVDGGDRGQVTVPLQARGQRSEAWVTLPLSWAGQPLRISLGDDLIGSGTAPDPAPLLRDALLSAALRSNRRDTGRGANMQPRLPGLLTTSILPQAVMPDPLRASIAGVTGISTRWFAADGSEVSTAEASGRHGAITTVSLASEAPVVFHQTCFRLPDESPGSMAASIAQALGTTDQTVVDRLRRGAVPALPEDDQLPRLLAAASEVGPGVTARPNAQDQAWWHRLKTKLGTQTVYEYHRLMPKGYDDDTKKLWPAILYLHGSGGGLPRDYPAFKDRNPNRDLHGWAAGKGDIPFAIYSLASFGGWEPPAVLDTLDRILASDRIDPDRVIIMGFSMGGMGTWACAVDHPERWAAVVPIGGRGAFAAEAQRVKHLPVWVFNGEDDRTTTLADAMIIVNALKAIDGNVRVTSFPGVGHGAQNHTYETPGLWEWLAEQRRRPVPPQ